MSRTFFLVALILSLYNAAVSAAEVPLIFEGRYEFIMDQESLEIVGAQVCFFPSLPTSKSVPRPAGDQRLPWFCFSNSANAANMLGFKLNTRAKACGIHGTAKVTVIDYKRYTGEGDDNDVATLKAVLSKSQPEPLPCTQ